jgi:oligoribonuclease NrnB/cAMP/cGMP phosphodiesterase (DHH superfamily)
VSEENLSKKFEEEFNKLSEKDKREVNNLIRFMQEKKYHDSQYEELLNQYIELSRDYEKLENIIKEVREKLLCYGETFDLKLHQQMQKELLEILDDEKI